MKRILIALACLGFGTATYAADNLNELREAPVIGTVMKPFDWAGDKLEGPVRRTGGFLDEHVGTRIRGVAPHEEAFDEGREIRMSRGLAPNHR